MRLMHAALPGMLERRSGTILNIASVSAVMPRSTYGAVKNWQVQFSRWANGAYRSRGVTVTAVCADRERFGTVIGAVDDLARSLRIVDDLTVREASGVLRLDPA